MQRIDSSKLCGIRKGIVFYLYKDIDKNEIKRLYNNFCNISNARFKYYFIDSAYYKKISNDNVLYDWLKNNDFSRSSVLELTDGTKSDLQTNKAYFSLSNYNEKHICNLPSVIYLECSCDIAWKDIYEFILEANKQEKYYYICSNYVVGVNGNLYPRSTSEGIKMLKGNKILSDATSVWLNFDLLKNIKNGIDGPNVIQVIPSELAGKIPINSLNINDNNSVRFTCDKKSLIINLIEDNYLYDDNKIEKQFQKLYSILKPIILDIKRPKMFWKDDTWKEWRTRFALK